MHECKYTRNEAKKSTIRRVQQKIYYVNSRETDDREVQITMKLNKKQQAIIGEIDDSYRQSLQFTYLINDEAMGKILIKGSVQNNVINATGERGWTCNKTQQDTSDAQT